MTSIPSPSNPISCADVQELLPEFVTGELGASASIAIESHAAGCDSCAREIAGWRQATGLVKRAANSSDHSEITRKPAPPARSLYLRPLALAASLVLAFGLGLYAGRVGRAPNPGSGNLALAAGDSIANRYRHAATASPNTNSLGLALLSMARRE